jgi:hypothetical protein
MRSHPRRCQNRRFEVTEVLANGIFTVLFAAAMAWSCLWFFHTFLEAETAIIHSMGGK